MRHWAGPTLKKGKFISRREDMAEAFFGRVEEQIAFAHGHTFAGNPLACAVGIAVLEEIQEKQLDKKALGLGSYLKSKLESLRNKFGIVREVRGRGMLLGVEQQVRPWMQYLTYLALQSPGEKAILGKDGWLFYKPDVQYLVEPSPQEDPVAAILAFRQELSRRGIRLLVLPMPGKRHTLVGRCRPHGRSRGSGTSPGIGMVERGIRAVRSHSDDRKAPR